MLLGLLYPTGGRLTVFGASPRSVEAKRMIGYLPEETYLYKYLSAYETLDFFASLFNLSAAERAKRSEQLLDMVGLAHARNRQVGEFSKGMARRIGLAQAMINDPSFLILDEPTSGLDPIGCREVKDLIRLLKRRGKTVLVTSHLLGDVEDVCDRVIILYGGKIRAQGAIDELLTVKNTSTITVPDLPPDALRKIAAIVKESTGKELPLELDHPRMSLEDFFLDVVNSAKKESVATSGATSGGEIAEYLSDGLKDVPAEKKLAVLAGIEPKPAPEEKPAEKPISAEAEKKLEALDAAPKPAPAVEPGAERKKELSEADRKLAELFSGKNK